MKLFTLLSQARQTPWIARNELIWMLVLPRAWLVFAWTGIKWGKRWRLYGVPIVQRHRAGMITLGDGLNLRSTVGSNPLAPYHPVVLSVRRAGAKLLVGNDFGMTGGTLCADESITIGNRVTVGANTTIIDTDFHPLDPHIRQRDPLRGATAPVVIEDDVFIGMACFVLKGAHIGAGSVIGAGSIVTGAIPPGVIATGQPARVIKPLP